ALRARISVLSGSQLLGLFRRFVNAADVHESLLGQVIPFPFAELLEAANGLGNRRHFTRLVGERLGDDEWLREELFNPPDAGNHLLILFAKFIDAQNGNDVLKFAVALQYTLNLASNRIVLHADVLRIQEAAVGRQRINSRVNALFRNPALEV